MFFVVAAKMAALQFHLLRNYAAERNGRFLEGLFVSGSAL
jgi:hypothetical protein